MDFSREVLDAETEMFVTSVEQFLDEELTSAIIEAQRTEGHGHSETLHHGLGARGWITPHWPVAHGGAALDPLRCEILERLLRDRGAPLVSRDTTLLALAALEASASEELTERIGNEIARGRTLICLGYTEPDAGSDLAAVRTRATVDGDGWIIDGAKMFTTGAQFCDYALVLARTDSDAPKHRGLTVFLVPLHQAGVEIQPLHTLGGERTNSLFLTSVAVPDDLRIGRVNDGWAVMNAPLAAEHGATLTTSVHAEISGQGALHTLQFRRAFTAALRWAVSFTADGGPPPINDPLVCQRLASIALDLEVCRNTPGLMGRLPSAELFIRDAAELLELVGPAALVEAGGEGSIEAGIFESALRFAQGTAIYGGTTEIFRNMIATRLLGLPRA